MEPSWQIKLWIETTLKKRPDWGGIAQECSETDLSVTGAPRQPASVPPWRVGDALLGRYKVMEIRGGPGKSGMGVVYVVLDLETGEIYAAKTLQNWAAFNSRARKRFERESKMWIELENHPNIVKAYFIEHVYDRPYLFLEFVPGLDVSTMVKFGALQPRLAVKFAIQICRAMSHAARRLPGFVHRDIKPSNCLTSGESLKLTDFGLAKAMDRLNVTLMPEEGPQQPDGGFSVSREGKGLGTLPYMAPELFTPGCAQDVKSDIYAFGVTFYKMLTARLPFRATSPEEWMEYHRHLGPRDPVTYAPGIPPVVRDLVLRCLNKKPEHRFKDFNQIADLLSSVLLKDFSERIPRDSARQLEVKDIVNKGLSYWRLGFGREALELFDRAIAMDPGVAGAWSGRALVFEGAGRHDEALPCCDRALALDSVSVDTWVVKGRILAKTGEHGEAVACFDSALGLRAESADVLVEKGKNLFYLGRHEDALACFDKVVEIMPQAQEGWLLKGLTLLELGRCGETLQCVNQALHTGDGQMAPAWACKGDAYFRLGKLAKAEQYFKKAITLEPKHAFYHVLLGCTYVRMGRMDLGRYYFKNAEKLDPGIAAYLRTLDEHRAQAKG